MLVGVIDDGIETIVYVAAVVISITECDCVCTVRGKNFSSDAVFTPKMDIFKQTILNTAYIKTLKIFLSARESLSVQTSISRSVSNQSRLHGS